MDKNIYLVTLHDDESDTIKTMYIHGFAELQSFINNFPGWKYRISIFQVDEITNVSDFLKEEGQRDSDNPFSLN